MRDIGSRLKQIRESKGLNQAEFANLVEISQSMLSGIETGRETLSDRYIKIICLEFGINEDWLKYGGDRPMYKKQGLTTDENELLEIYDKLNLENRKNVRIYADERLELQELRKKEGKQDF